MHPALAAFPTRPLSISVRDRPWLPWVWALVGLLLFGAYGAWLAFEIAPSLVDDVQIQSGAQRLAGGRVSEGHCHTHYGLFTDCDVTLSAMVKGRGQTTRDVHYLFTDFHTGDYTAVVMADPARPELLTTDVGLDRMWSRIITFIVMALFAVVLIGGSLAAPFLARRRAAMVRAMQDRPLVPEVATFTGAYRGTWSFRDARGARANWNFGSKFQPFLLGPYVKGKPTPVLAVTAPGIGGIFPLDAALATVNLTEDERRAVIAARNAAPPVVLGAPAALAVRIA